MPERSRKGSANGLREWLREYEVNTRRFWVWTAVTGPLFPVLWIATVATHRGGTRREETADA